jgi:hypothetical protein
MSADEGRELFLSRTMYRLSPSGQLDVEDAVRSEQADPFRLFAVVNGMTVAV